MKMTSISHTRGAANRVETRPVATWAAFPRNAATVGLAPSAAAGKTVKAAFVRPSRVHPWSGVTLS